MILTVAGYKGGVGKTTTAIHLAAYLNTLSPTVLLDDAQNKSSMNCARRGAEFENGAKRFPFRVALIDQAAKLAREFEHIVIDTGEPPSAADLEAAAEGCDLMILPVSPNGMDTDGLGQTVRALQAIKAAKFRVLLTCVAPDEAKEALELRELLASTDVPVFPMEIPRLKAFKKAATAGLIVKQCDDRQAARAWAAYESVGKEMLR